MTNSSRFLQNYATTPLYNTKLVVGETGVPADTFRAWERRYGLPQPQRGDGGQRLYSERDIATIRWLRDRTNEGLTISQAVALLETEADAPSAPEQPRSPEALQYELVQALLRFDAPGADMLLSEAFAMHSLDRVCMQLIQPVLIDVGTMWHAGTASIAQEHFASQFLRRKLQALLNIYDVPEGRATIVAGCAPGELHDLGLLVLALLLVRRNYKIIYLGADVPVSAMVQTVHQVHPDILCISATSPVTGEHAMHMARTVLAESPELLVFIGGQGAIPAHVDIPGLQILEGDGLAAAEQIGSALTAKRISA